MRIMISLYLPGRAGDEPNEIMRVPALGSTYTGVTVRDVLFLAGSGPLQGGRATLVSAEPRPLLVFYGTNRAALVLALDLGVSPLSL